MKQTTAERDPQAVAKLRELIQDINVAMLITVTPDGALRSRPMLTQDIRKEGELWFYVSSDAGAVRDIAEEPAVNVSYSEPKSSLYVSVSGQATLVTDKEMIRSLWDDSLTRYFPKGLEDPHLALLRVRIETAEYWDASSNRMASLQTERKGSSDGT